jgi:tRNA pseudouridine65 synthase
VLHLQASQPLEILHRDEDLVVIVKPPGYHVHQPEEARHRVTREIVVLTLLRRQIEQKLFPIHRLDVATEGVLAMALNSPTAGRLQREFQEGRVKKIYHAVVRGWVEDAGEFDFPLERDSNQSLADARTRYRCLGRTECPFAIGKRFSTARFSLVEVEPLTGRWHQIRRHFSRSNHPIVGDREHGDSHHNKYFRHQLGLDGLWLRASLLELDGKRFVAPPNERWSKMSHQLGLPSLPDLRQNEAFN